MPSLNESQVCYQQYFKTIFFFLLIFVRCGQFPLAEGPTTFLLARRPPASSRPPQVFRFFFLYPVAARLRVALRAKRSRLACSPGRVHTRSAPPGCHHCHRRRVNQGAAAACFNLKEHRAFLLSLSLSFCIFILFVSGRRRCYFRGRGRRVGTARVSCVVYPQVLGQPRRGIVAAWWRGARRSPCKHRVLPAVRTAPQPCAFRFRELLNLATRRTGCVCR